MSELSKYEGYKKKLQGICDENNLVFRFHRNSYPITLTIQPVGSLDAQMTLIDESDDTSPDAALLFTYKDGVLSYKTSKTFTISDALFSKIKNLFKNMHNTWLQFFFRDVLERGALTLQQMPQIDDEDEDDPLPDGAEPLEEFDEDFPNVDLPHDDEVQTPFFDDSDPIIAEAIRIIRQENKATVSLLQRTMHIGYAKASALMDTLERLGIIGPYNGSTAREVLPYDEPEDTALNAEEGYNDAAQA